MKSIANILFAVLLSSLAYFASSHPDEYSETFTYSSRYGSAQNIISYFLYKLEKNFNSSAHLFHALPFVMKDRIIEDLAQTSEGFKNLCISYDVEHENGNGQMSQILAINKTIYYVFYYYKESAGDQSHILEEIENVDPIGLNVYLTKNNIEDSSPSFMTSVMEFQKTMYDRVRLINMRTDNSYITIFDENRRRKLHHVNADMRKQITTEYEHLRVSTIDLFTDIVTKQLPPGMKMYRQNNDNNVKWELHTMSDLDDVQIPYGEPEGPGSGHCVCTYYKASDQKVYVYDSALLNKLDESQHMNIIRRYPYNNGIEYVRPLSLQGANPTCALYAIAYATMLLMGEDPVHKEIKTNKVHGDESLYIRIHLLNMLVNRKFSAFN